MNYIRKINDDLSVEYKIIGELMGFNCNELLEIIHQEVRNKQISYFIFDLSETTFIDSCGINVLVIAGKYNYERGKNLKVKSAKNNIKSLIQIANLTFIEFNN